MMEVEKAYLAKTTIIVVLGKNHQWMPKLTHDYVVSKYLPTR